MEIIDKKEFTDAIKAAYPEKKENPNIKAIKEDIVDAVNPTTLFKIKYK